MPLPSVSSWSRHGKTPLGILITIRLFRFDEELREFALLSAILVQTVDIATRWNVVIGGQMFSKELQGTHRCAQLIWYLFMADIDTLTATSA